MYDLQNSILGQGKVVSVLPVLEDQSLDLVPDTKHGPPAHLIPPHVSLISFSYPLGLGSYAGSQTRHSRGRWVRQGEDSCMEFRNQEEEQY